MPERARPERPFPQLVTGNPERTGFQTFVDLPTVDQPAQLFPETHILYQVLNDTIAGYRPWTVDIPGAAHFRKIHHEPTSQEDIFKTVARKFADADRHLDALSVLDEAYRRDIPVSAEDYTGLAISAAEHGDRNFALSLALDDSRMMVDEEPTPGVEPTPEDIVLTSSTWLERISRVSLAIDQNSGRHTDEPDALEAMYEHSVDHYVSKLEALRSNGQLPETNLESSAVPLLAKTYRNLRRGRRQIALTQRLLELDLRIVPYIRAIQDRESHIGNRATGGNIAAHIRRASTSH
jgi:hypothetical protein